MRDCSETKAIRRRINTRIGMGHNDERIAAALNLPVADIAAARKEKHDQEIRALRDKFNSYPAGLQRVLIDAGYGELIAREGGYITAAGSADARQPDAALKSPHTP